MRRRISRQQLEPAIQAPPLFRSHERIAVPHHQFHRNRGILGSQGMLDGLVHQAVLSTPGAGSQMHSGNFVRCQLFLQEILKEASGTGDGSGTTGPGRPK